MPRFNCEDWNTQLHCTFGSVGITRVRCYSGYGLDVYAWRTLKTPDGKRIRFKSAVRPGRCRLNSLKGVSMDTVPVIRDYPDVFPEELPGMPPDREVEFLIDLMPGTRPIAKRPYKMDVD